MQNLLRISEQTFWQILSKLINTISTLLVLGLITGNYGQEGTGVYTLALTYLVFFYLAADLSLNNYSLAKYSNKNQVANSLLNIRLIWSLVLIVIANLLVFLLPFNTPLFQLTVLLGSVTILFNAIAVSVNLVFQGNLRFQSYMLASTAGSITTLLLTALLVFVQSPMSLLITGVVGGWVINSLLSILLVRKFYSFKLLLPKIIYIKNLLSNCWPLSATLILNTVYFRLDSFILTSYKGFNEVAVYNLAYSIFQTILVVPTFIMNSFYPLMLKELSNNYAFFVKQVRLAALLLSILSIIVVVIIWLLSPFIIPIIAGSQFNESISTLRYLSFSIPAFFLSALLMWVLMCLKKFKPLLSIYSVGLVVNLVLNLLLIPRYGINGAILVTIISEYLILFMQIMLLWRGEKYKRL